MPTLPTGLTSIDVLKINNSEEIIGLVDDAVKTVPELGFFNASPITKNEFNTLVNLQDPKVGFREPGAFANHEAAKLAIRPCKCAFLDASWKLDQALAEKSDWGKEKVFAIETLTHLRSAFMTLAQQIWYGVKNDTGGFRGLYELIGSEGDDKSNADLHIDAQGTGTGLTSIFAVSTGEDSIQLAWGSEGKLDEGDVKEIYIPNPANAKNSGAHYYSQKLTGWCGLQVTSSFAFGRIKNISEETELTDDMLFELVSRFPVGREPQAFFMNRRTLNQLRKSRTAVNITGAPAPIPTELAGGIPIIVTDAIMNTEETLAA